MPGLRNKVLRGVIVMFFKEGWSKLLGVVGMMILARLLFPSDFGYIATLYAIINFSTIFISKGIFVPLVQHKEVDDRLLAGTLRVCAGMGAIMSILLFFTAPYLAHFFHGPLLVKMLHIVAPALLFRALAIVPDAVVQKRLYFLKSVLPRLVSEIFFWVVVIGLSWCGLGAMSVAWAMLISSLMNMILSWSVASLNIKIFFYDQWQVLWRSGVMVALIEIVEYFIVNIDGVIIMKCLGPTALGFYFLAFRFSNYFYQEIGSALSRVFFPVFSFLEDASMVRRYFLKAIFFLGVVIMPFYTTAFLFHRELVSFVYGDRWLPAALPLSILCLAGIVKGLCIGGVNKDIFYARKQLKAFLCLKVVIVLLNVAAVLWGLAHGIVGVAIAVTVASVVSAFCVIFSISRLAGISWQEYMLNIKAPFIASVVMCGVEALMKHYIPRNAWSVPGIVLLGIIIYFYIIQSMRLGLLSDIRGGVRALTGGRYHGR